MKPGCAWHSRVRSYRSTRVCFSISSPTSSACVAQSARGKIARPSFRLKRRGNSSSCSITKLPHLAAPLRQPEGQAKLRFALRFGRVWRREDWLEPISPLCTSMGLYEFFLEAESGCRRPPLQPCSHPAHATPWLHADFFAEPKSAGELRPLADFTLSKPR